MSPKIRARQPHQTIRRPHLRAVPHGRGHISLDAVPRVRRASDAHAFALLAGLVAIAAVCGFIAGVTL